MLGAFPLVLPDFPVRLRRTDSLAAGHSEDDDEDYNDDIVIQEIFHPPGTLVSGGGGINGGGGGEGVGGKLCDEMASGQGGRKTMTTNVGPQASRLQKKIHL